MALPLKVKKKGKDQESIQFSTTPDPRHKMGKRKKHNETLHTKGDHNAARNKQEIIIKVRKKGKDPEYTIKHHT